LWSNTSTSKYPTTRNKGGVFGHSSSSGTVIDDRLYGDTTNANSFAATTSNSYSLTQALNTTTQ
jgi:hypothetical protein